MAVNGVSKLSFRFLPWEENDFAVNTIWPNYRRNKFRLFWYSSALEQNISTIWSTLMPWASGEGKSELAKNTFTKYLRHQILVAWSEGFIIAF